MRDYSTLRGLFLSILLLLAACGPAPDLAEPTDQLRPEERFLVDHYLRLVEARRVAAAGDARADSLFKVLSAEIPADSLLAIGDRISTLEPERWLPIYEEIERRKRIMEETLR